MSIHRWIDITQDMKDRSRVFCEKMAEVKRAKGAYAVDNDGKAQGHYLGKLGECVFSVLTGEPVDWECYGRDNGDGGTDFYGCVDVKSSTFVSNVNDGLYSELKEDPNTNKTPLYYVLIEIDLHVPCGIYRGFATYEELHSAPLKNYGYGWRRHLPYNKLHQGQLPVGVMK